MVRRAFIHTLSPIRLTRIANRAITQPLFELFRHTESEHTGPSRPVTTKRALPSPDVNMIRAAAL